MTIGTILVFLVRNSSRAAATARELVSPEERRHFRSGSFWARFVLCAVWARSLSAGCSRAFSSGTMPCSSFIPGRHPPDQRATSCYVPRGGNLLPTFNAFSRLCTVRLAVDELDHADLSVKDRASFLGCHRDFGCGWQRQSVSLASASVFSGFPAWDANWVVE